MLILYLGLSDLKYRKKQYVFCNMWQKQHLFGGTISAVSSRESTSRTAKTEVYPEAHGW